MSRRFPRLVLTLTLCTMLGSVGHSDGEAWRRDGVWDDGQAEFCAYAIRWPRYDNLFEGRVLLILVKEPWDSDSDVKADTASSQDFDVLKLNHVRDVPTGIYTYHQMASVYLRRDSGRLRKLATTSSEACGITTATVRNGRLETRSYFEGQGDRARPFPAGALPEDGLPALLRDFVTGEAPESLSVFPSLMAGRLPELKAIEARLSRRRDLAIEVAGRERRVVELRLEAAGGWSLYHFDPAPPHPLLRLEKSDGTLYELTKCERVAYWQRNQPGGADWYPAPLRSGVDY